MSQSETPVAVIIDDNERVREHLANERTYLAYLRTSIALISLGISVNRFSLFLLEKNIVSESRSTIKTLVSAEQLGIGMLALGLVLLVWGTLHYTFVYRQIREQHYRPSLVSIWVLSSIIIIATLAGVVWLFIR